MATLFITIACEVNATAFPTSSDLEMTTLRRALALSFLERYLSIVLALGSGMVMARLLTPEQIGMYSVTLAVIGLAHVLREFGVGSYLIQQKDLIDDHVRTAFGLALAMGTTLAMVIYSTAPWVARFYNAPEMAGLMRIVALNFLVLPFCSISLSLLRRAMQFKALLYVNLTALSMGTAVTLTMAWAGYGPTSMAVGAVVGNVTTGFGAWWARGRPVLLRPGWKEWRAVLNFGGQSAVAGIVTTVAMDINDLVVGKVLGFAPVAVLSRAQGLANLVHRDFMSAVRNVALPAFAQAHRDGENLEPAFIRATAYLAAVAWPIYVLLSTYALEVIRLMFGPQWDSAAGLVPLFCLAGSIATLTSIIPSLLIAAGRIDLVTWFELTMQPLRICLTVGAVLIWRSVESAAFAYLVSATLALPVLLALKSRAVPIDWRAFQRELLRAFALTIMATVPALVHVSIVNQNGSESIAIWQVILVCTICLPCWFLGLLVTRHPMKNEAFFKRALDRLL